MPLVRLDTLPPDIRRELINRCSEELNFVRFGNRKPFYLWEQEQRREVETVLRTAETFFLNRVKQKPAT